MSSVRAKVWNVPEGDDAIEQIERFVQSLSDSQDARSFNQHFAADVVWGNPSGGTLTGFDALHAVHRRFFEGPMRHSRSRFTLVNVVFYRADLAVAHVRREATDDRGAVIPPDTASSPYVFHEMALYVLILRDGEWWLAAGQNTPLRKNPLILQ
jgi:uncharacterized protein (TIGR02246 family)